MRIPTKFLFLLSLFSLPSTLAISTATTIIPTASLSSNPSFSTLPHPTISASSPSSTLTTITTSLTPSSPQITTPPSIKDLTAAFKQKWHIETYYSCATFPNGYEHCGWHAPVRPGGTEIAGAPGRGARGAGRNGLLAGAVVLGVLLR